MTKALEDHNVDQMQLCLSSHLLPVIQQYINIKSEPRSISIAKLPSINRITRLSISISIKQISGVVLLGALSNSTSEAISLRSRAAIEVFVDANRAVLHGPVSTLSVDTLKRIILDVETVSSILQLCGQLLDVVC